MNDKNIKLEIQAVDFSDANEVCDFARLLVSAANESGLFMSDGRHDKEYTEIWLAAKEWVNSVEETIDIMNAGDALAVTHTFDFIHRVAYGVPAKAGYLDRYRLGAFEAFIHGDKSVDPYVLFHTVSEELDRKNKAYFDRPLDWHSMCLDRWHRNFRTGRSAASQSDYDTVRQVAALLSSDLWAFEHDQNKFKRMLAENHRRYLTDETTADDTKMRQALQMLRFHAAGYLTSKTSPRRLAALPCRNALQKIC